MRGGGQPDPVETTGLTKVGIGEARPGEGRPHVVIVGGGFGGLYAARTLARAPVRVTLIDRRNHHLFQPLLYQVATAALNPSDIAAPIRSVLRRQKNAMVILGEVTRIDAASRKVVLAGEEIAFDYLVVATGVRHAYFGHDEWEHLAPGLKSIEDALEIRKRILLAFEAAEREDQEERRRRWLTFVVVGGGPTGVELAGALAEISRHALARDFRRIDPTGAKILLLEGGPRILPTFPPELSDKAARSLSRLGVEVRTGAAVHGIDDAGVMLSEERIESATVLWAAGVRASPLAQSLGVPLDRLGRVQVRPDLSIPGHDDVFVIGDLAALEQDGRPLPGVAPVAIQQGRHVARTIVLSLRGRPRQPFRYRDQGALATIGRGAAVALLARGRCRISGFPAWVAWLAIHIFFLIGFRNRLLVMIEWAWAYLSYQRGARLITGETKDQGDERR
jgi:NADH dehydrogenase